jgi:hypothetical protein
MATSAASVASPSRARPSPGFRVSGRVHAPRKSLCDLLWHSLALRVRGLSSQSDGLEEANGSEDYGLIAELHQLTFLSKAAMQPASMATSGWASELVTPLMAQLRTELQDTSVVAQLAELSPLSFSGTGAIKIPTRASTPKINAAFCGEAQPIPVRRPGIGSTTLLPKKMAVISEFTNELSRSSAENIAQLLRAVIAFDTGEAIDTVLLDATAADAVRPAGLRNGVAGLSPSLATAIVDKIAGDIKALIAAVSPATLPVLFIHPLQNVYLAGSETDGIAVLISPHVTPGTVIMVDAGSLAIMLSAPGFAISGDTTVVEEDTAPPPFSTGSPAVLGAPIRSAWQTDSTMVRSVWPVNWATVRTGAVAWIGSVAW